ncbi:hypothetical protein C5N14_30885 [Micromonospora sp. MW-13]|uniref:hypothetical protein n=1 Tax=Micromonospora sp. MW-13 TaxID=2094022 RepID=UPI000E449782|nr:hypothetical protein [Micromonospora sp. MW-13]RGC64999.1 hypothetical protein C5N14_30885 [Micromonospora sp. MW-13]
MTFADPIVDDTELIRDAIRSPNYIPGVSGWSINRDGSAEFSDARTRGAVVVGDPAGSSVQILPGAQAPAEVVALYPAPYVVSTIQIQQISPALYWWDAVVVGPTAVQSFVARGVSADGIPSEYSRSGFSAVNGNALTTLGSDGAAMLVPGGSIEVTPPGRVTVGGYALTGRREVYNGMMPTQTLASTQSTYVDLPGGPTIQYTKLYGAPVGGGPGQAVSRLAISASIGCYSNVASAQVWWGVRIRRALSGGGTLLVGTYDLDTRWWYVADHAKLAGDVRDAGDLPAGDYQLNLVWRQSAGATGVGVHSGTDRLSLVVEEQGALIVPRPR